MHPNLDRETRASENLGQMSRQERERRAEELRASRPEAVGKWLGEFAHLKLAGFRSHITADTERHDLACLRAGEPGRLRGVYPHEATPWAYALTAHYLQTQASPATATPFYAILDAGRRGNPRGSRWLSRSERVLANLAEAPDATLLDLSLAHEIYRSAQRRRVDSLAPDISDPDEGLSASPLGSLENAAQAGDRRAAYALGLAELNGIAKHQRPTSGVRWLQRAATLGHSEAQYDLGTMYAHGWSVPRDEVVGLAWLLKAERKGHDHARRQARILGARLNQKQTDRARRLSATPLTSLVRPPPA